MAGAADVVVVADKGAALKAAAVVAVVDDCYGGDVVGDFDMSDDVYCPICDGPGVYIGRLGGRDYYRCRDCGMEFSRKA